MKFGVLQFPGSCDEVDALHAARKVGDAQLIWHGDRDLAGADAIVVPGGFSYGDYLRAGAIARFSPAMESVIEFAHEGGLVLGICNGFQVLCEARLLPGALLANANLRFTSRLLELDVIRTDTAFTRACAAVGEPDGPMRQRCCGSRRSTRGVATTPTRTRSRRSRLPARWCCATLRGRTSTARCTMSPVCAMSAATCSV